MHTPRFQPVSVPSAAGLCSCEWMNEGGQTEVPVTDRMPNDRLSNLIDDRRELFEALKKPMENTSKRYRRCYMRIHQRPGWSSHSSVEESWLEFGEWEIRLSDRSLAVACAFVLCFWWRSQ